MRKTNFPVLMASLIPAMASAQSADEYGFAVVVAAQGLSSPTALGVGPGGDVFVGEADDALNRVVRVNPTTGAITALATGINTPMAIVSPPAMRSVYTAGLYVTDGGVGGTEGTRIWRIDLTAPAPTSPVDFYNAGATSSTETTPVALAFDQDGRYQDVIFVADSGAPDSVVRLTAAGSFSGATPLDSPGNLVDLMVARSTDPAFGFNQLVLYNSVGGGEARLVRVEASGASAVLVSGEPLGVPARFDIAPDDSCFQSAAYISDVANGQILRVAVSEAIVEVSIFASGIAWGDEPTSGNLAFSADGRTLFALEDTTGRLLAFTVDGNLDTDRDDIPDGCDPDDDDDGVDDVDDNCPLDANPDQDPTVPCDGAGGGGDDEGGDDAGGERDSGRDQEDDAGRGGSSSGSVADNDIVVNEGCSTSKGSPTSALLWGLGVAFAAYRRRLDAVRKPR